MCGFSLFSSPIVMLVPLEFLLIPFLALDFFNKSQLTHIFWEWSAWGQIEKTMSQLVSLIDFFGTRLNPISNLEIAIADACQWWKSSKTWLAIATSGLGVTYEDFQMWWKQSFQTGAICITCDGPDTDHTSNYTSTVDPVKKTLCLA